MNAAGVAARRLGIALTLLGFLAGLVWTAVDEVPLWQVRLAAVALVAFVVIWHVAVVRTADRGR